MTEPEPPMCDGERASLQSDKVQMSIEARELGVLVDKQTLAISAGAIAELAAVAANASPPQWLVVIGGLVSILSIREAMAASDASRECLETDCDRIDKELAGGLAGGTLRVSNAALQDPERAAVAVHNKRARILMLIALASVVAAAAFSSPPRNSSMTNKEHQVRPGGPEHNVRRDTGGNLEKLAKRPYTVTPFIHGGPDTGGSKDSGGGGKDGGGGSKDSGGKTD